MIFNPTHIQRKGFFTVQVTGEAILMSEPHEGLVGIIYKNRHGKTFVQLITDFTDSYKPIRDAIEEAVDQIGNR